MFVLAKKTLLCNSVKDAMWYSCDKTFSQAVINKQNDFRFLKKCVFDDFLIITIRLSRTAIMSKTAIMNNHEYDYNNEQLNPLSANITKWSNILK